MNKIIQNQMLKFKIIEVKFMKINKTLNRKNKN